MSSNWESGPAGDGDPHAALLFMCEHRLKGRWEKAGEGKGCCSTGGWMGQAPSAHWGQHSMSTAPAQPPGKTFSVGSTHISFLLSQHPGISGGCLSLSVRCDSFPRRQHPCREVGREPQ